MSVLPPTAERALGFVGPFHLESRLCVTDQGDGVWTFTGTCAQLCAGLLALPVAVPKFFLQAQWGKVPELLPQLYLRLYKIHTRKELIQPSGLTLAQPINKRTHKILLREEQIAGPKLCLALSDLWHQHISSNKN